MGTGWFSADSSQNSDTMCYELLHRPKLYQWSSEIEKTLKQILCNKYHFPMAIFLLFISFVDKSVIYDPNSKIHYPIFIPKDLVTLTTHTTYTSNSKTSKINNYNDNRTNINTGINAIVIKVAIHGDEDCGRTAIMYRFLSGEFMPDGIPRYADYYNKEMVVDGNTINLEILNTGKEFLGCGRPWRRGFDMHLIVFSMDDYKSFKQIYQLLDQVVHGTRMGEDEDARYRIILVGNKSDLLCDSSKKDENQVDLDDVIEFAKEEQVPFVQTSAKVTHGNVDLLFEIAAQYVLKYFNPQKI